MPDTGAPRSARSSPQSTRSTHAARPTRITTTAFAERALRTEQIADAQLAAGHAVSARSAYLRAATYYDLCLFFVLGTRQHAYEASVYARMQRNWNAAARLFDPPFERVRIPYDGSWLPGYFLSRTARGERGRL